MLTLEKLVPKKSNFTLKSCDEKFTLRPMTVADECWIKQENLDLQKAFQEIVYNSDILSKLAFRLLDEKSKQILKKRKVKFIDEEGNEKTKTVGGIELFRQMIGSVEDKVILCTALLETIGYSREIQDQLYKDLSGDEKKKTMTAAK